jgi:hypothetical protein
MGWSFETTDLQPAILVDVHVPLMAFYFEDPGEMRAFTGHFMRLVRLALESQSSR